MLPRIVTLEGFESLHHALVEFHDEPFDLNAMEFNRAIQQWTGRFYRPLDDPRRTLRERTGWIEVRHYFPVVEATFLFRNVFACQVRDDSHIGRYSYDTCRRTETGCTLEFIEALTIHLELAGPVVGELREREYEHRGYVRSWAFLASGTRLEDGDASG